MPSLSYLADEIEVPAPMPVNGVSGGLITGKRLFRVGTFKDSKGVQHTWTSSQLDALTANFSVLTSDVGVQFPVRIDHSASAKDVIGWISRVYRDGDFLLGDLLVTEPDAYSKWSRGTLGPLSAEIGSYETNNGDIFAPSLTGVAFVDIAAVEGLYRSAGVQIPSSFAVRVLDSRGGTIYNRAGQEDDRMTTTTNPPASVGQPQQGGINGAAPVADLPGTPGVNAPAVAVPSNGAPAPGGVATGDSQVPPAAPVTQQAPAQQAPAPAPAQQAPAPAPAQQVLPAPAIAPQQEAAPTGAPVQAFRLAGQDVTDPVAIQRYIESLENSLGAAEGEKRDRYVDDLVMHNKIAAPQADGMKQLARGMTPDQFASFRAAYGDAQVPVLAPVVSAQAYGYPQQAPVSGTPVPGTPPQGEHQPQAASPTYPMPPQFGPSVQMGMMSPGSQYSAPQQGVPPTGGGGFDPRADEIAIHQGCIQQHRLSGMSEDKIKATSSYKKLVELTSGAPAV
jgi:hypothetical protein